jgi:hypothetical protein
MLAVEQHHITALAIGRDVATATDEGVARGHDISLSHYLPIALSGSGYLAIALSDYLMSAYGVPVFSLAKSRSNGDTSIVR